jgi:hypothetical protein
MEGRSSPRTIAGSEEVVDLMVSLMKEGRPKVGCGWVAIPETDLEMRLRDWRGIKCLLFRKNKNWVYANIFCFEGEQIYRANCLVARLYRTYMHAIPPDAPPCNWIHTIPINDAKLASGELRLIDEITQFIYLSIYRLLYLEEAEFGLIGA